MGELPITIYDLSRRPQSNYAPRLDKQRWTEIRAPVERMFAEGMTQKEILKALQDEHDFRPSTGQLVLRMAKWGLTRYRTRKNCSPCPEHNIMRNSNFTPAVTFAPGCGFDAAKWCSKLLRTMSPLMADSATRRLTFFLTLDHMVGVSLIMGTPLLHVRFSETMRRNIELEVMQHLMHHVASGISAIAWSENKSLAVVYRTAVDILLLAYISFQHGVDIAWAQRHLAGFMSVCQTLGMNSSSEHDLLRFAAALDNYVASATWSRSVLGLQSDPSDFVFQEGRLCPVSWCIRNKPFATFGLDTTMVQVADVNSVVLIFPENDAQLRREVVHGEKLRSSNVRTFAYSRGSMVAFGRRSPNNPMINTLLEDGDQHLVHASTERGATGIMSRIRCLLTG